MPERLRVWIDADPWNGRIIQALMEGVAAGLEGAPIGESAGELGYAARSAQGDAFETGWEFGRERRGRTSPNMDVLRRTFEALS